MRRWVAHRPLRLHYVAPFTPLRRMSTADPSLHTPLMRIDEAAMPLGVRTMTLLALDYLHHRPRGAKP